jgi:hypothetical protein
MTFVNAGTLGTVSGHRDELVATLTQRNDLLREFGCSVYEFGGFRFDVIGSPLRDA